MGLELRHAARGLGEELVGDEARPKQARHAVLLEDARKRRQEHVRVERVAASEQVRVRFELDHLLEHQGQGQHGDQSPVGMRGPTTAALVDHVAGRRDQEPVADRDLTEEMPASLRALVDRVERRRLVGERHPDHGVIGEEYGEDRPDADFVWVIDPIDGTRAFIAGLPVWTTLIGLRYQGQPVLGSIGQSFIGEIFIGHAGGSRLISSGGERPLKVRACPSLADAVIASTDPYLFKDAQAEAWKKLHAAVRLARYGCDAYAYAMVAAGSLDLVVETGLKAWDIESAIPLLAGAGGLITDWRGDAVGQSGGRVAIAGDRRVLDEALGLLGSAA